MEVDEPEDTEVVEVAAETELPLVVELAEAIELYEEYPLWSVVIRLTLVLARRLGS